jgi:hydroxyethylthiazole kinase
VQPDAWRATVSAMAMMGVVGEIAAEKAVVRKQGVGSMQVLMLDELHLLDQATFTSRLNLEFKPW